MTWPRRPLLELCEVITDGTHHSPPNGPEGQFKYVTAKNIRPWGLDLSNISYVSDLVHRDIYARCPVQRDDVLYIKDGVTTGLAVVNPLDEPFSMLSSVALLRPKREVFDSAFLCQWLNSPATFAEMTGNMTGTAIKRLVLRQLRSALAPVPPLNEQRRIVAKLEALQDRSRRAREALDAVPPLLEKLRRSILGAAFRGDLTADWRAKHKEVEPASELLKRIRAERRKNWEDSELTKMKAKGKPPPDDKWKAKYKEPEPLDTTDLPELPHGWCWARASDVVAPGTVITYGIVLPGAPQPNGIPYVRGQDIEEGRILTDQLWRTTSQIAKAHSRSALAEGDVLLCIIRHLKVAIVPRELEGGNITQGTVRLRPSSAIRGEYLARFLEAPGAQAWMKARYFGNAMPRINVEDAREIPVPVAPIAEQVEVSTRIALQVDIVARQVASMSGCAAALDQLDRSLLAKGFRGELVPQDPNDEPADSMLARQRGAHPKAEADKKKTRRRHQRGGRVNV